MDTTTKSEVLSLKRLLTTSEEGGYGVPLFQRGFVWRVDDVIDLLDSIYRGFPIGSLLLWKPHEHDLRDLTLTRLDGEDAAQGTIRQVVLDGQQRLRSILGALTGKGPPPENGDWRLLFFDLNDHTFVRLGPRMKPGAQQFPLEGLLDTFTYLSNCDKLRQHPGGRRLIQEADRLAAAIRDYSVPVVTIEGADFTYAAEVFGRVNTKGVALSAEDLLAAKLWRKGFDFRVCMAHLREELPAGFRELHESTLMKAMLAAITNEVTLDKIQKIYEKDRQELTTLAAECAEGVQRAVIWLHETARLPALWYLPYGLQLILLADLLRIQPDIVATQRDALLRWFWSTSFSGFFAGANTALQNSSLRQLRRMASGDVNETLQWFEKNQVIPKLPWTLNLRATRPRLTWLVLAEQGPLDIETGRPIPPERVLSASGPLLARLFKSDTEDRSALANHILYDGNAQPLHQLLLSTSTVRQSHLVDEVCVSLLALGDYQGLLMARQRLIERAEESFLQRHQSGLLFET